MTSPWRTVSDKPKPHCWWLVAMQTRGYLQRAGDDDSLAELQASLVGYMAQRGSSIVGAADTRTGHDPTHLQAALRGELMAEARLQHNDDNTNGGAAQPTAQPTARPHHWDTAGPTKTEGEGWRGGTALLSVGTTKKREWRPAWTTPGNGVGMSDDYTRERGNVPYSLLQPTCRLAPTYPTRCCSLRAG